MTPGELAERYAVACFGIALEEWIGALRTVSRALQADPSAAGALDDRSAPFADRQRRMERMIPADTPPSVRRFFGTLLSNGDAALLPRVLADLERLATEGPAARLATVMSAVELDEATRQRVDRSVKGRYGKDVQVRYEVDPQLIGGLVIRVGDEVIDGSVAARLRELDSALRRAS